jgi:mono/diheme cytochrome c family protein
VKNIFKVLSVVALSGFGAAAFTTGGRSIAAESVESGTASRALYRTHCASCHGTDGKSNTKKGRETEASDLTDPGVKGNANDKNIRIIRNGKGDMPGFKGKLTSAQIASVARYIKSL